jgi:DNA-nicking Smr family endonuclease
LKRRELPEDARQVFREAVADAVPLASDRAHHEPPPPPAIPRSREQDEAAALAESIAAMQLLDLQLEGGDQAAWAREGVPRSVLRDLRRGRWVVEAQLDLHGLNRDEARAQVALFIVGCVLREQRCVRIVHGKGLSSPGREPVLKRLVLGWLAQKKEVLAFCQARTVEGGAGAVVVLLAALK